MSAAVLRRPWPLVKAIAVILLAGWLCWQIVLTGLAGLASRSHDPRLLATMGSTAFPEAASNYAELLLATGDLTGAEQVARATLLASPTSDRAARVLGLALEKAGQTDAGATILRQAAALGWRDTPIQLWTLNDAAVHDDAVTVIQRADALARRNRMGELTRPIFMTAVTDPALRAAFIDSLAAQPMWRGFFFADVRRQMPATSADGMAALFHDMQLRKLPIAPVEWLSYVDRLVGLGQFDRARTVWMSMSGTPASRLADVPYDGDLTAVAARPDGAPSGPFEWSINPDLIGTVGFDGPQGARLTIPADIPGATAIASQLVILPPGPHRLSARVVGTPTAAGAGWTITCLPSKQDLPRQLPGGVDDELSAVAFTVPTQGCNAQRVSLTTRDRLDTQQASVGSVQIR